MCDFGGKEVTHLTSRLRIATSEAGRLAPAVATPMQSVSGRRAEDDDRREKREREKTEVVRGERKSTSGDRGEQSGQPLHPLRTTRRRTNRKYDLTLGKATATISEAD